MGNNAMEKSQEPTLAAMYNVSAEHWPDTGLASEYNHTIKKRPSELSIDDIAFLIRQERFLNLVLPWPGKSPRRTPGRGILGRGTPVVDRTPAGHPGAIQAGNRLDRPLHGPRKKGALRRGTERMVDDGQGTQKARASMKHQERPPKGPVFKLPKKSLRCFRSAGSGCRMRRSREPGRRGPRFCCNKSRHRF